MRWHELVCGVQSYLLGCIIGARGGIFFIVVVTVMLNYLADYEIYNYRILFERSSRVYDVVGCDSRIYICTL